MTLADIANRVNRPLSEYERSILEEMARPLDHVPNGVPYIIADRAAMATLIFTLQGRYQPKRQNYHPLTIV